MQTTLDSAELATAIHAAWEQFVIDREGRSPTNRSVTWASDYSPCARYLTLKMTDGDKVAPMPAEALANFRRGKDWARNALSDLAQIGRDAQPPFEVQGQEERFELKDRRGRVVISGKVDATLRFAGGLKVKVEAKAWNPNTVARIHSFDDLFHSPWTTKGAYQMLAYLYGSGDPIGMMLLGRHGIPAMIPVDLEAHLGKVEEFLTLAERALDCFEAGELPEFIENTAECRRCPFFGGICNPPTGHGAGALVFTDHEFAQKVARWHETKEIASEHEALDEEVKKALRGVELGIVGDFLVEGKWQKRTEYLVPAHVKEQIEFLKSPFKSQNSRGSFRLEITKV